MLRIKTFLLLAFLTALLLGVGYLLGSKTGFIIALFIALAMNFFSYWYSDKIVLAIYRAEKASKKEYPGLHSCIEDLSKKAKLPKPKIFILPMQTPNAFATGRNTKHAAVAVTQGALQMLDKKELSGVLSHELSHIKNNDILITTIAAVIAGVIGYIAFYARMMLWMGDNRHGGIIRIIALIVVAIFMPLAALLIQLAISRTREFIADESAAKLLKDGRPLASALSKLDDYAKARPLKKGNNATACLFIVNPFSAKGMAKMFSTHPSTEERVKRLRQLKF